MAVFVLFQRYAEKREQMSGWQMSYTRKRQRNEAFSDKNVHINFEPRRMSHPKMHRNSASPKKFYWNFSWCSTSAYERAISATYCGTWPDRLVLIWPRFNTARTMTKHTKTVRCTWTVFVRRIRNAYDTNRDVTRVLTTILCIGWCSVGRAVTPREQRCFSFLSVIFF